MASFPQLSSVCPRLLYLAKVFKKFRKKNIVTLEQVQLERSPRWLDLEHLLCEKRLRELGFFCLEKSCLWSDLTASPSAYRKAGKDI